MTCVYLPNVTRKQAILCLLFFLTGEDYFLARIQLLWGMKEYPLPRLLLEGGYFMQTKLFLCHLRKTLEFIIQHDFELIQERMDRFGGLWGASTSG